MDYKVFVVEDDESLRGLYEIAFQDTFDCRCFENAESMLDELPSDRPVKFFDDGLTQVGFYSRNEFQHTKRLGDIVVRACVETSDLDALVALCAYEFVGETRTLDMHIKSLRAKIAQFSDTQFISTIRGVGYKLVRLVSCFRKSFMEFIV